MLDLSTMWPSVNRAIWTLAKKKQCGQSQIRFEKESDLQSERRMFFFFWKNLFFHSSASLLKVSPHWHLSLWPCWPNLCCFGGNYIFKANPLTLFQWARRLFDRPWWKAPYKCDIPYERFFFFFFIFRPLFHFSPLAWLDLWLALTRVLWCTNAGHEFELCCHCF